MLHQANNGREFFFISVKNVLSHIDAYNMITRQHFNREKKKYFLKRNSCLSSFLYRRSLLIRKKNVFFCYFNKNFYEVLNKLKQKLKQYEKKAGQSDTIDKVIILIRLDAIGTLFFSEAFNILSL